MRRVWLPLLTITGVALVTVIPAAAPASAAAAPPQVRVNQVGYPADGPKVAFAMLPRKVAAVRFEVVTPLGVAYRGTAKVLYAQVGIGNGNAGNTIQGDYNFWFLPQREDRLDTKAAAYEDNVVSWPSVEPADDYTAGSLLAFALGAAGLG